MKNRRKTNKNAHRDFTWFDRISTSIEMRLKFFYYIKLGLHKKVYIITQCITHHIYNSCGRTFNVSKNQDIGKTDISNSSLSRDSLLHYN